LLLILPLLQLVRTTKEAALAQKANEVLKLCYATCTKQKVHPVPKDIDSTWELLKEIHAEAHKKGPKFHNGSCSRASTFVVKALMEVDRSNWDKAEDLYSQTKKDWFHKRRKVMQSTFFTEWISFSNEAAKRWEKK
jgi:DNA polymerase phi